jgi:hypothetical protein
VEQLRHAVETAEAPRPARLPLEVLGARGCRQVGIAPAAVLKAVQRGTRTAAGWQAVLGDDR